MITYIRVANLHNKVFRLVEITNMLRRSGETASESREDNMG
jgi:hypothetical protein